MNKSDLQQQYQHFQLLQQQIEQLTEHLEFLHQQRQEVDNSIDAVQQLAHVNAPHEFLAPLANGIFVKGNITETQTLLVNVGAEVAVEKTIPQVAAMLAAQKKMIGQRAASADQQLQELTAQAMKIYREVEQK